MDIDGFIVYIKKIDIHVGIEKYVEKRFGASNYELGRSLLRGKSKKLIGLIKDELSGEKMRKCAALRAKHIAMKQTTLMKTKIKKAQ